MRVWDVATGQEKGTITGHTPFVWSVAFSPDGTTVAGANNDGTIRLWDVTTWQKKSTLGGDVGRLRSVAFSPDGTMLASGGTDVRLWDVATGEGKSTLTGHTRAVGSVAFSPDGTTLASGSDDDTVRLWDVATGQEKHILTEHTVGRFRRMGPPWQAAVMMIRCGCGTWPQGRNKAPSQDIRPWSLPWCFRRMG